MHRKHSFLYIIGDFALNRTREWQSWKPGKYLLLYYYARDWRRKQNTTMMWRPLLNYNNIIILFVPQCVATSDGPCRRRNGVRAQMALSASSPSNRLDVLAVGEYLAVFIPGDHVRVALVQTARHKTRTRQLGRSPRPSRRRCHRARPSIELSRTRYRSTTPFTYV